MRVDELIDYCLTKPGAWRDQPWDETPVTKVDKKVFVFFGEDTIGVKCGDNRDEADVWLQRYPEDARVMSYIGRSGWNTLDVGGSIPERELLEAIDDSYLTVVSKLPKSRRPDGWEDA